MYWPGKCFFIVFWLSKIIHSSEKLKVIYIKRICVLCKNRLSIFKTSELKNVDTLVRQIVEAIKS